MKITDPQARYSLVGILRQIQPTSLDAIELHGYRKVDRKPVKIVRGEETFLIYWDNSCTSYYVFKSTDTGFGYDD